MIDKYIKPIEETVKIFLLSFICLYILHVAGIDLAKLEIDSNFDKLVKYIYYVLGPLILFAFNYMFLDVTCNLKPKKLIKYSLLLLIVNMAIQILLASFELVYLYLPCCLIVLYLFMILINQKITIKKFSIIMLINLLYQYISLQIRNITLIEDYNSIVYDIIMNIDYILLCLGTYILYKKNSITKNWYDKFVSYFRQFGKFKNDVKNYSQELSKKSKIDKFTEITFIIFAILWNIGTLVLILVVAKINNTLVECMFIISGFLISKHSFGKPFHFNGIIQCFIISNLTYFILNRITTPLGISIIVPILLGVILAYGTSLLAKKERGLYRGMPKKELFEMCKKLNRRETAILEDFYCKEMTTTAMAIKYNYSVGGLYKVRQKILKKLVQ